MSQTSPIYSTMQDGTRIKVKVVPYTFARRGVLVREDTYPEPSTCEVGWPVPFLTDFISPVLLPGSHSLLDEQWASIQSGRRVGFEPKTFSMGGMRSNHYATSPWTRINKN